MISQETKQVLFDICSQNKPAYTYIIAYVKIEGDNITDVEWAESKLLWMDFEDIKNDLLELTPVDIEVSGYYLLKGLFPVEYDSDDYRSWMYITDAEIIEFDFDMTLEECERQQKEWEELGDVTDLFN